MIRITLLTTKYATKVLTDIKGSGKKIYIYLVFGEPSVDW